MFFSDPDEKYTCSPISIFNVQDATEFEKNIKLTTVEDIDIFKDVYKRQDLQIQHMIYVRNMLRKVKRLK